MKNDNENTLLLITDAEKITGKEYIEWTDGDKLEGYVKEDYLNIIDDLVEAIYNADGVIDLGDD